MLKITRFALCFSFLFALIFLQKANGATSNIWTGGGGDGLWNTAANWSTGAVPNPATDAVFITTAGANITMNTGSNVTFTGFIGGITISGGATLDLDGNDLIMCPFFIGICSITNSTVKNGRIIYNGCGQTAFAFTNSTFGQAPLGTADCDIICNTDLVNSYCLPDRCRFYGKVDVKMNVWPLYTSPGGNHYYDTTSYSIQSWLLTWVEFQTTYPDTFDAPTTFTNRGRQYGSGIYLRGAGGTTIFNDDATFENINEFNNVDGASSPDNIKIGTLATSQIVFNGPVYLNNVGRNYFNDGRFISVAGANGSTVVFNNNVYVNDTTNSYIYNGFNSSSHGGVFIGNTNQTTYLNSGSISVGDIGFTKGQLQFLNFRQVGNTPQSLILTDSSNLTMKNSTFEGPSTFSAPEFSISSSNFGGDFSAIATSAIGRTSITFGINTYSASATFTGSNSSGVFLENTSVSYSNYLGDVTFLGDSVQPCYIGNSNFYGDVNVNTWDYTIFGEGTSGPRAAVFTGGNNQYIDGTSPFSPLINYTQVNKSDSAVALNIPVTVGLNMTLTKGVFDLNSNVLTMKDAATTFYGGSDTAYVKSEDANFDGKVKWNIGTTVANYTFPFGVDISGTGHYIPVTYSVTTAGDDANGNITAATYHTDPTATPNNRPLPPTVTNTLRNGAENADHLVDRYWHVAANSYTVAPAADVAFIYPDPEWTGVGTNTITEANLLAHRWDSGALLWELPPVGVVDASTNTFTLQNITNDSYWVLVDSLFSLKCPVLPNVTATSLASNVCPNGDTTSIIANGAVSYEWTPDLYVSGTTGGSILFTAPDLGTYTYSVTGTDAMGCENTTTAQVVVSVVLPVSAGPDITVCYDTPFLLTASGASSFAWSPAVGINVTVGSSIAANPPSTTTYTVVGTTSLCTATDIVKVNVLPLPTVFVSGGDSVCSGKGVVLTAASANAISYTWSPSTELSSATGILVTANLSATNTITVTGVRSNGCSDNASIVIHVLPSPSLAVTSNSTNICDGDSISLDASGATDYFWTPADGVSDSAAASITAAPHTSTTFMVYGSIGECVDSASVAVTVNPMPTVEAGNNLSMIFGQSVQLNASATTGPSYLWSPAYNLTCLDCLDPTADPDSTTIYTITVSYPSGCSAQDSLIVFVDVSCKDIFVPSAFSPNGDTQNDVLYAKGGNCAVSATFQIYSRWGELVFQTTDLSIGWDGTFNGENALDDVYVYTVNITQIDGSTKNFFGNTTLAR